MVSSLYLTKVNREAGAKMSLEELYEDQDRVDEDLLRSTLLPYIRLARDARVGDPAFRPTADFDDLSARGKTLVVLLTQRARATLGDIESDTVPLRPTMISAWTGIAGGTLRPALRRLASERLVMQPARGMYELPPYAIEKAAREIAKECAHD